MGSYVLSSCMALLPRVPCSAGDALLGAPLLEQTRAAPGSLLALAGSLSLGSPSLVNCHHTSHVLSLTSYVVVSPSDKEFSEGRACLLP